MTSWNEFFFFRISSSYYCWLGTGIDKSGFLGGEAFGSGPIEHIVELMSERALWRLELSRMIMNERAWQSK